MFPPCTRASLHCEFEASPLEGGTVSLTLESTPAAVVCLTSRMGQVGCCASSRFRPQGAPQLLPSPGYLPLSRECTQASLLEDESYVAQWLCVLADGNELTD